MSSKLGPQAGDGQVTAVDDKWIMLDSVTVVAAYQAVYRISGDGVAVAVSAVIDIAPWVADLATETW